MLTAAALGLVTASIAAQNVAPRHRRLNIALASIAVAAAAAGVAAA